MIFLWVEVWLVGGDDYLGVVCVGDFDGVVGVVVVDDYDVVCKGECVEVLCELVGCVVGDDGDVECRFSYEKLYGLKVSESIFVVLCVVLCNWWVL